MSAADTRARFPAWPGWCLVAGGAAMIGLWLVFTASHGPTSVNENRLIAGRGMHFWGLLLGVVPNLLVVVGLIRLRAPLVAGTGRSAAIGYVAATSALAASAVLDLYFGALGPPIFLPITGGGLVLYGVARPRGDESRRWQGVRSAMLAIGVVLLVAFAIALIPLELSDRFSGFRIYGALAHLVSGLGWIGGGIALVRGGWPETA